MLSKKSLLKGGIFINNMINWNEFNQMFQDTFNLEMQKIDDLYLNVISEKKMSEFIEYQDIEIIDYLIQLHPIKGEIYVINDYCYDLGNGPFCLDADNLYNFVQTFNKKYGEPFYSTDIIIINFKLKHIWVFFHEGLCWFSDFNSI